MEHILIRWPLIYCIYHLPANDILRIFAAINTGKIKTTGG